MDKQQLLKDLRAMTQAGMQDCKAALDEAKWELDKAVDIVKARGLANTSRNAGKVASEGRAVIFQDTLSKATLVEINCQTDFVASNDGFVQFCNTASSVLGKTDLITFDGDIAKLKVDDKSSLEDIRKAAMAATKENVVIRRWMREEALTDNSMVFSYMHSNNKLGVLVSLEAPTKEQLTAPEFIEFGNNVAMQIAAMNPLAVSLDKINQADKDRQRAIFETQLRDAKKPEAQWSKIIEGKFRKWGTEVALLEQESVITAKMSIRELADGMSTKLCGEAGKVKVISFLRCQVGEGIEKVQEDYSAEISKLTGIKAEEAAETVQAAAVTAITNDIDKEAISEAVESSIIGLSLDEINKLVKKVAWEIIPQMAENLIKAEVKRLMDEADVTAKKSKLEIN